MATRVTPRRYETREVSFDSEIDVAWLAAIVDGEGHIKAETLHRWSRRNNAPVEYRYVRLMVVNCCRELLEHAEAVSNIGRITARVSKQKPHHRDQFVWQVCGRKATTLLELLLPHLIAKRDEAIAAIAWFEGGALS